MYAARVMIAATALMLAAAAPAAAQVPPGHPGTSQAPARGPDMMGGMGGSTMQHMMGGMMGSGMMGSMPCSLTGPQAAIELTPEMVQNHLDAHITMTGNERLKVGEVTRREDGSIVASVITKKEGAVVDKFAIDPKNPRYQRID